MGERGGYIPGGKAGFCLLCADVHLQQNILCEPARLCGAPYAVHQLKAVHTVDERRRAHHVPDLVFLQMPDEVQRRAVICVLGVFLYKLLHAVLPADGKPRRDCLAHARGIVHLRRADEVNILRAASGALRGEGDISLCQRHVIRNAHCLYPSNDHVSCVIVFVIPHAVSARRSRTAGAAAPRPR